MLDKNNNDIDNNNNSNNSNITTIGLAGYGARGKSDAISRVIQHNVARAM
jgi:hypothetical protein